MDCRKTVYIISRTCWQIFESNFFSISKGVLNPNFFHLLESYSNTKSISFRSFKTDKFSTWHYCYSVANSWVGLEGENGNNSLSCTRCPPALVCKDGHCECGKYVEKNVLCHHKELLVKESYCVTYNDTTKITSTGHCVKTSNRIKKSDN